MSQSGVNDDRTWAGRTLGERVVVVAWRAVAAHLAMDQKADARAGQVATGGAGALDGVTDDALLPPPIRDRLR